MRIGLALFNICLVLLISCGNDQSTSETMLLEVSDKNLTITATAIQNLEYTDYVLSEEAVNAVADWEKYLELAIQMDYLRKEDLSFFNGEIAILKEFLLKFKVEAPENLLTNHIISRTVIVETKILKLHDNLSLANINVELQLQSIKEVLEAFANLNLQINKKLEFDIYSKIEPE